MLQFPSEIFEVFSKVLLNAPAKSWRSSLGTEGSVSAHAWDQTREKGWREGQDGRRVRRGDHLPSHRYSRNIFTRGTAPIEHLLNAGRRCQTSQKARKSPRTRVGQKKKEITETKE